MLITLFTAALTFSACTAARWYLRRSSRREADLFQGRVHLTELWNSGGAFGLPITGRLALLGALAALAGALRRGREHPLSAGLLAGGGAGNLWERLRRGAVYDYVRFPKAPGILGRYVFNLADFAIILGGIGIAAGSSRRGRKK